MSGVGPIRASGYSAILQRAAARRAAQGAQTGKVAGSAAAGPTRGVAKLGMADPASFSVDTRAVGAPATASTSGIDKAFAGVHESQANADKMVIDLASGQDVNIHNTMVELEKADIALKYTVQLRNRALSAYEELMRMQV